MTQISDTEAPPLALDPRRNAMRPDLADERLRQLVQADVYVSGQIRQVRASVLPMRKTPEQSAGLENEAVFGELVRVFEERDGWAWIQLERDGYVGYAPAFGLSAECLAPTHRVSALGTFIYPEPSIKTAPILHLALNAQVAIAERQDRFSKLSTGGYVIDRHLAPLSKFAPDFTALAERFVGTPYLWGGRTRIGLDCSGLVQTSLEASGIVAPRDTDMQREELGAPVEYQRDGDGIDRGDLVFWSGHVGIMVDAVMMVHANGHHMSTVVEPLAQAAARISRDSAGRNEIIAIRRLDRRSALRTPTDAGGHSHGA